MIQWLQSAWVIPAFRRWTVAYVLFTAVFIAAAVMAHRRDVALFNAALFVCLTIVYGGFSSLAKRRGDLVRHMYLLRTKGSADNKPVQTSG